MARNVRRYIKHLSGIRRIVSGIANSSNSTPLYIKCFSIFGKAFSFTVSCWNFLLAIYVTFVFKTDEQSKEKIELEIEGGKITGEYTDIYKQEYGVKFVETVLENKNSKTTIIAEPDLNYTIRQIHLP